LLLANVGFKSEGLLNLKLHDLFMFGHTPTPQQTGDEVDDLGIQPEPVGVGQTQSDDYSHQSSIIY
jgi:hypothetical protein